MTTSAVRHELPQTDLSDRAVADLQLHLDGVILPWARLGGVLEPAASGTATAPRSGTVALEVRASEADAALAAGGLLLGDREHTPVARLIAPELWLKQEDRMVLTGRVTPVRRREARLFVSEARTPTQLEPSTDRRVLVLSRPPVAGELADLRSGAREVLVLVPVEGPTPDGVPARVLMRCTISAVAEEAPDCLVVPVAMAWRDPASDAALSAALGRAYGSMSPVQAAGSESWDQALAALRDGLPTQHGLLPGVWSALRDWLPPRGRRGLVVLLTGLSGSGKSTLARGLVEHISTSTPRTVSLLDGDDVRRLLSSGLGFDRAARDLNVRRIGYVASEIARHGGIAVCAPIAPYAETREVVRRMVEQVGDLVLVHVSTPLEECERRDLKGLYARARAGLVKEFTGISDPYDVPVDADVRVDTSQGSPAACLDQVLYHLHGGGWLPPPHLPGGVAAAIS